MRRSPSAFAVLVLSWFCAMSRAGDPLPPAPAEVVPLLEAAVALQEAGQHEAAIEQYEAILAARPDLPQALAGIAFSEYATRDWLRTVSVAERLMASGRDCPVGVYLVIGSAYGMLGQWDKAEAALVRGQAVWPDDEALRFHRAINVLAQGRVREAIGQLEDCIRISPYQPECWRVLGDALRDDGARGRAFAAYARALSLEGNAEESREAAQRMWTMLFETGRPAGTSPGDPTEKAEAEGLSLLGELRNHPTWKDRSDSEFFAYALDTLLKLVAALHTDGTRDRFWGPFAFAYFDGLRGAGHMTALAFEIRRVAHDPEARRWGASNAQKVASFRAWSERWVVDWSAVAAEGSTR